jgi:uncharacterized protein YkwD
VSKRTLGMAGIAVALTWLVGGAAPRPAQAQDTAAWAQQVLTLVNQERANAGLNALRMSPELSLAAQRYSKYMADANFFAHEGPDGSTPGSRQQAAGYQGAVVWGENIAAGQPDPQSVMTAWMNSPGHRANILFRGFTEIGIGIYSAPGTRYGVYWTQEFGARPQGAGSGSPSTYVPPPATTPTLSAIAPDQGAVGDVVTLTGQRFGSTAGSVSFAGVQASLLAWSDTRIQVRVPAGAASGSVYVQASSGLSNGRGFTVLQASAAPPSAPPPTVPSAPSVSAPTVTYMYPSSVRAGSRVTLYGRGFGASAGTVRLNDVQVTVNYWYDSIISVTVPNGATSGQLVVETASGAANAGNLTVISDTPAPAPAPAPSPAPTPTPSPGLPGGSGAGSGGTTPVPVGPPAPITPPTPAARPIIRSITYENGPQGRTMTLHGSGFGTGTGFISFGRLSLPVLSWSDTTIVLQLPAARGAARLRLGITRTDGRSTQVRARS